MCCRQGTAYATSKGAMTSLTFSVARQYVDKGVTCNGIAPCYVFGPMIVNALSEERRAELLEAIPVRKFCTPEEVAHTVDYLVHPLASFVTVSELTQPASTLMIFCRGKWVDLLVWCCDRARSSTKMGDSKWIDRYGTTNWLLALLS